MIEQPVVIADVAPERESGEAGFTLIEMLVALVVMGLFAGLISGIIRPDERALLRVEAERLAQLLDLAGTEARTSGKPVAWTADGSGYRFWRYREGAGWSEISDNTLFRRRELPPSMAITNILSEAMSLRDPMRLEFGAHGIMPVYDISMVFGTERYTVSGSPAGEVEALPGEKKANAEIPPR